MLGVDDKSFEAKHLSGASIQGPTLYAAKSMKPVSGPFYDSPRKRLHNVDMQINLGFAAQLSTACLKVMWCRSIQGETAVIGRKQKHDMFSNLKRK